jgi:hypothetical protein
MPKITNEDVAVVNVVPPIDANDAALTGDWVSMKNAGHATIIINCGAGWGSAGAVTLTQATAVAGTGTKALAFSYMWTNVADITASTLVKTAVTSNTFNLSTSAAGSIYIIEVEADTLDADNDFDVLGFSLADPGAAGLVSVTTILSSTRFLNLPDALVD